MSRAINAGTMRVSASSKDKGYFHESELPLTSLVFLLPLMVIYEIGTHSFTKAAQNGHDQQIIAFTIMQRFFKLWGVHGQHLPTFAVVVTLLCIHFLRGETWRFHLSTLVGMFAESLLLALPLVALAAELPKYFPLAAISTTRSDLIIMSLGAGVYEELVFRLILFSALSFTLRDAIGLHPFLANLGIVVISALAFSAYHYLSPLEHFQMRSFAFRTIAGAYFGVLFIFRGFGITASSHAAYDILILFV